MPFFGIIIIVEHVGQIGQAISSYHSLRPFRNLWQQYQYGYSSYTISQEDLKTQSDIQ